MRAASASRRSSASRDTVRAQRVLHPEVVASFEQYERMSGCRGLRRSWELDPSQVLRTVLDSGLRGRGGAGFPVGRKWQTVAQISAEQGRTPTVIVNGAEGEPWTFKDRSILRRNPYLVIEGALIAARAVGARRVVFATKASFELEVARLRTALTEMTCREVLPPDVACSVFEGPDEYLFGEESALLEAIEGKAPFPRVVPPYRRGLVDAGFAASAVVNNVESVANLPKIVARGPRWFRSVGTPDSPGTAVCTVSGDVRHAAVGEVRMGVPLRRVLRHVGGGPRPGHPVKAVLSGVANAVITADQLDVPLSHEGFAGIGSGLGAAGFAVFGRDADMVAVAAGVARFLSVESCGQCTPCKFDGITLSGLLEKVASSQASCVDLERIEHRISTVAYGARCYLGVQQETVLGSLLRAFRSEFDAHLLGTLPPAKPFVVAELLDIRDGSAVLDERQVDKQPDWSFDASWHGSTPVELHAGRHSTNDA